MSKGLQRLQVGWGFRAPGSETASGGMGVQGPWFRASTQPPTFPAASLFC